MSAIIFTILLFGSVIYGTMPYGIFAVLKGIIILIAILMVLSKMPDWVLTWIVRLFVWFIFSPLIVLYWILKIRAERKRRRRQRAEWYNYYYWM